MVLRHILLLGQDRRKTNWKTSVFPETVYEEKISGDSNYTEFV